MELLFKFNRILKDVYKSFNMHITDGQMYEIITLNGKQLILYDNHTYSRKGSSSLNQYCSKKSSMHCKAKLTFNRDGSIKKAFTHHNHDIPLLFKTKEGTYLKIK